MCGEISGPKWTVLSPFYKFLTRVGQGSLLQLDSNYSQSNFGHAFLAYLFVSFLLNVGYIFLVGISLWQLNA